MPEYGINKGVNKAAEFRGMRAQYLGYFGGSLLGGFMLFVVLKISGLPLIPALIPSVGLGGGGAAYAMKMNKKYGQFGLMKTRSMAMEPKQLKNLGTITGRLKINTEERKEILRIKKTNN